MSGRLRSTLRVFPVVIVASLLLAWGAGRVLSDRWAWSQWLLWIPTPAAVLACGIGLAAAAMRRKRRPAIAWAIATTLTTGGLLFVEHRFLRFGSGADRAGITLAHWNLTHGDPGDPDLYATAVTQLDADLVVLTNAGPVLADPRVRAWVGPPRTSVTVLPFTVVSRLPIREIRPLVAAREGVRVTRLVVDTPEAGPLTVWLTDLPSDPRRGRMALVRRTRTLLASLDATPPDLIVGDLNLTRGSAALRHLAPEFRHAWDVAGRGWGGTWPRPVPLYHIDHVLAAPGLAVIDYRLADPGVGLHRVQSVRLNPTARLADGVQ